MKGRGGCTFWRVIAFRKAGAACAMMAPIASPRTPDQPSQPTGVHWASGLLMSPKHTGRRRMSDSMERSAIMAATITTAQDEDGIFVVECPAIPGCVSQGRTRDEAEQNIRDAIRQCLAVRREQGLAV